MEFSTLKESDICDTQLAADFARLLAANFAREVPGKESDEEAKSSHDSHVPRDSMGLKVAEDVEGGVSAVGELSLPKISAGGPRVCSGTFLRYSAEPQLPCKCRCMTKYKAHRCNCRLSLFVVKYLLCFAFRTEAVVLRRGNVRTAGGHWLSGHELQFSRLISTLPEA